MSAIHPHSVFVSLPLKEKGRSEWRQSFRVCFPVVNALHFVTGLVVLVGGTFAAVVLFDFLAGTF